MASRNLLVWCNILLILSLHPISAVRNQQVDELVNKAEEMEFVMKELQRAVQEDMEQESNSAGADGAQDYWFESWASCEQRKEDFERRSGKVKARLDVSMEDGKVSIVEASWVILKVRVLAKTHQAAVHKKCDWVMGGKVDISPLHAIMNITSSMNPCLDKAKEIMAGIASGDEEEMKRGAKLAMGVLLSKTCKAPSAQEVTASDDDGGNNEETADDQAETLTDMVMDEAATGSGKSASLLEADVSERLERISEAWSFFGELFFYSTLALVMGFLIGSLTCLAAAAAFFIFWAPLYTTFWCAISKIIVAILRVFQQKPYEVSMLKCMEDVFLATMPASTLVCLVAAAIR